MSGCSSSSDPSGSSRRIVYWTGSTLPTRSCSATKSSISTTLSGVVQGVNGIHDGRISIPCSRSSAIARAASSVVWPLSSRSRISSLTDSNAETTNRQPAPAAVEEVGIAEGDVAGAQLDEARDVPHHGVCADDPDAPVVDGGHRAVAAPVHAAVARLDVAHEPLVAPEREVRVALERRQQVACRQLELAAAELDERLVRPCAGR